MSLRKTEIAVEAVDQNLERVLQRLEIVLLFRDPSPPRICLRFESKRAQIGQQMPEDLQLIGHRKTIELQHDRRIERSDVAMPDVVRDAGKKDIGVTAFERDGPSAFREWNGVAENIHAETAR